MNLRIDWVGNDAAAFATKHWHYSHSMPCGGGGLFGVWEDERFIGVVIYSRGSNRNLAQAIGLNRNQACELTRVALSHHETSVSRIVSITLKKLKRQFPEMLAVVSYADTAQGHVGRIYQAGNWIYLGSTSERSNKMVDPATGGLVHGRTISCRFGSAANAKKHGFKGIGRIPIKHKYAYPLDPDYRKQLLLKAKPYPKHAPEVQIAARLPIQAEGDGANPISALHVSPNGR